MRISCFQLRGVGRLTHEGHIYELPTKHLLGSYWYAPFHALFAASDRYN